MNKSENYKELLSYRKALLEYPVFINEQSEKTKINFSFDSQLCTLISKYKLPLKEASLNELEHIKSLLHWISENIPHDGYTNYRSSLNACSLLDYRFGMGQGVNCLMTAIIMQELCMAFGYSAHLIQGNPADYTIMDCHWLVNIYLPSYGKWATFDPVWCGFCYDAEGTPLSFLEIRNMLIKSEKFNMYEKVKCGYYYYLLCRYLFFFGYFTYNGFGTFDISNQQKIYAAPVNFDSQAYVDNKSKEKAKSFTDDLKEYMFFSRHEEKAIHTNFIGGIV